MLVGPPGVGKSRAIGPASALVRKLDGFHVGPISVTGASFIDAMANAKRVMQDGKEVLHYNSLFIIPDDLQALLHKWDPELVANMTVTYDTNPYLQTRRTGDVAKVEINSPQLSLLIGTTNSQLLNLLPLAAWDQGFMARMVMIHSAQAKIKDDLFSQESFSTEDLLHDLKCIFTLKGQLGINDDFRGAFNDWRQSGFSPAPSHPRLKYYNSRRTVHLLKLAIISCVDRGAWKLSSADYLRAKRWLLDAETTMPDVFTGSTSVDGVAMEELVHAMGDGEVIETKLTRMITQRVNVNAVKRMLELMVETKLIVVTRIVKGQRYFKANRE